MTYQELTVCTIALLKKDGWTQGTLGGMDAPKCLIGATLYAAGEFAPEKSGVIYDKDTKVMLCDLMRAEIGGGSLSTWNDTPGRIL